MDAVDSINIIIVFSLIIVLPLIWIRIRGDKESGQYQERLSQDWTVTRHDKEPEEDEKKE